MEPAIKPVALVTCASLTTLPNIEEVEDIYLPDHTAMSSNDSCSDYEDPLYGPDKFNQSELNGLIWDLFLSNDQSEILATTIQEKNKILNSGTKVTFCRTMARDCFIFFQRR